MTGSGIDGGSDGAAKLRAAVEHIASDISVVFRALISAALGLASIMAKGFHWV